EGDDLEHADVGHVEEPGDIFDRLARQPVLILALRKIEQRQNRALLAAFRIVGDKRLCRFDILRGEFECLACFDCLTHRSTSPNTISRLPRMADASASICPLVKKSMPWRWANPGALILQR